MQHSLVVVVSVEGVESEVIMSRIAPTQLIPGPIDALTQGLLAGAKLKALQSESQTRALRNQLLAKEIQAFDQQIADEEELNNAMIASHEAQTTTANLQSEITRATRLQLIQQQELATEAKKDEIAKAKTGEVRAGKESE